MGNSLQDELLKAGLVDKNQLNKAKKQKSQQNRPQKGGKRAAAKAKARPAPDPLQAEKAARDRELNEQRNEVRRQRAVNAEVRQLVSRNRHPRSESEDDTPFHFDNKGKVKRIFVSAATHKLITSGRLVIVNDNGVFELVPPDIAEKIRQRNPSLVIDLPEEQKPDENDPYAQYQVPDDLMW
jgi:uncharacterized protein YaiL (DUF2058 family)